MASHKLMFSEVEYIGGGAFVEAYETQWKYAIESAYRTYYSNQQRDMVRIPWVFFKFAMLLIFTFSVLSSLYGTK